MQWKFTYFMMSFRINHRNKSIYPLKRICMHNLVGIYNKCTSEVLGVSCNGKPQGSLLKFMTSPIATSLFTYPHTITHTRMHTRSLSTLHCVLQDRAPSCWKMLLPAHLCVCTWVPVCIYVWGCICVHMKTPSHVSAVMALLKHTSPTQRFQAAV